MLAQALAVVEAARALQPVESPAIAGMWRLQCEPRRMGEVIRGLGESLAEFDAATGNDFDPLALVVRAVRYAGSRGIPAEEMVNAIRGSGDLRDAESLAELRPQPGEIGRPDAVTDGSPVPKLRPKGPRPGMAADVADKYKPEEPGMTIAALQPVSRPNVPVHNPVITGETATGAKLSELKPELSYDHDAAIADAGELVQDAGIEMDAISDRLEYVVGKIGWTPKLRMLAAAWIQARNKISANNMASTPGYKIDLQDALIIAKVSAELAQIEASPDFSADQEPAWQPPVPGLRR